MQRPLFCLVARVLCFAVLLFAGTHLMAYLTSRNPNDVVGWVALGVVCTLLARGRK